MIGGGEDAVGEAGAHGSAGREQAERRAFGDLAGEFHCLGADLILRHQRIGEAHPQRFFTADPAAGVEDQFGVVLADQFRQRRGEAEARMKTELGEVRRKPRLGAGDTEIRRYRKPEAAADGGAVDRGHDRLLVAEDPHRLDVEMADRPEIVGLPGLARASASWRVGSLKLAPAQNALPCAASTTARASGSLSISVSASAIWLISETSKKFSGGRRISMVVTWPVLSTPMSVIGGHGGLRS